MNDDSTTPPNLLEMITSAGNGETPNFYDTLRTIAERTPPEQFMQLRPRDVLMLLDEVSELGVVREALGVGKAEQHRCQHVAVAPAPMGTVMSIVTMMSVSPSRAGLLTRTEVCGVCAAVLVQALTAVERKPGGPLEIP